jgi:hypothetical protein
VGWKLRLTFHLATSVVSTLLSGTPFGSGRTHDDRVIGVCFDMFFKILWAFEGLATKFALVRLEGDMDSNV